LMYEVFQRSCSFGDGAFFQTPLYGTFMTCVANDGMAVAQQSLCHICAHAPKSDESKFHSVIPFALVLSSSCPGSPGFVFSCPCYYTQDRVYRVCLLL